MTTTVRDVCNFMEDWAPAGWAYPWDRVGLHTGNPAQSVERVLVCLTVTKAVVAAAIRNRSSMIVAHHPLIWEPLKHLRSDDPLTKLCLDLCRADIACFAAHTNLDIAPGGVNDALAARLQLRDTHVLFREAHLKQIKLITFVPATHQKAMLKALADAGAGIIGDYTHCSFNTPGTGTFLPDETTNPFTGEKGRINEEAEMRVEMLVDKARLAAVLGALRNAHPYEEPAYDLVSLENMPVEIGLGRIGLLETPLQAAEFVEYVRECLAIPHAILHGSIKRKIRKVAVLGGSGGDYVSRIPLDVDAYVTGDIGYHDAETARLRGVACVDASHYGTELPVIKEITSRLGKSFPEITVHTFAEKRAMGLIAASQTQHSDP